MAAASITLECASVDFPIYDLFARSLKNRVISVGTGGRFAADERHRMCVRALDAISLRLAHGARVALIGHNGAGKSTLLRVLAGIYQPTAGCVTITGRIAPLFDASLGMDPEATGYENVVLRGLFLGLSRSEIDRRMAEIVEFTDLGDFMHLPIRTYSDGMRARLSFAISTAIDPEILLLDEGIASGDAAFMERAQSRLDGFISRAGIIVLASHSEDLIRKVCTDAILLEHGRVVATGSLNEVLPQYFRKRPDA